MSNTNSNVQLVLSQDQLHMKQEAVAEAITEWVTKTQKRMVADVDFNHLSQGRINAVVTLRNEPPPKLEGWYEWTEDDRKKGQIPSVLEYKNSYVDVKYADGRVQSKMLFTSVHWDERLKADIWNVVAWRAILNE